MVRAPPPAAQVCLSPSRAPVWPWTSHRTPEPQFPLSLGTEDGILPGTSRKVSQQPIQILAQVRDQDAGVLTASGRDTRREPGRPEVQPPSPRGARLGAAGAPASHSSAEKGYQPPPQASSPRTPHSGHRESTRPTPPPPPVRPVPRSPSHVQKGSEPDPEAPSLESSAHILGAGQKPGVRARGHRVYRAEDPSHGRAHGTSDKSPLFARLKDEELREAARDAGQNREGARCPHLGPRADVPRAEPHTPQARHWHPPRPGCPQARPPGPALTCRPPAVPCPPGQAPSRKRGQEVQPHGERGRQVPPRGRPHQPPARWLGVPRPPAMQCGGTRAAAGAWVGKEAREDRRLRKAAASLRSQWRSRWPSGRVPLSQGPPGPPPSPRHL